MSSFTLPTTYPAIPSLDSLPPSIPPAHTALLRTVYANLVHQSDWKSVTIHTHGAHPLPRPMLCGVPAEPVMPGAAGAEEQREWVLPVGLGEKWSLRKGAEVFDALPEGFWGVEEGGVQEGVRGDVGEEEGGVGGEGNGEEGEEGKGKGKEVEGQAGEKKGRLRGKRIVMAIVGGDSTVVYYIMHEGIVKPRQN